MKFRRRDHPGAMFEESDISRRSFVKKGIAGTTLVGGALGATQPASAKECELEISGDGDYVVVVNDPDAYGENLESDDELRSDSEDTHFTGSVSGDTDVLHFDGWITTLSLRGELDVWVTGDFQAPNGQVRVEGSNSSYAFNMSYEAETTSDCESSEYVTNNTDAAGKLGWSDTDTFDVIGVITGAATFSSDAEVTMYYDR